MSVGEVNLLAPVMAELKAIDPGLEIAISTSTETGYELAQKKYPSQAVFFCPYDFSWAIANVINQIRPSAIVLAELELWPNMISVARSRDIPVVVINGRLSENSFAGYRKFRWFTQPIFRGLSYVFAQTEAYASRFEALGCPPGRIAVSGSVKFDGVQTNPSNARTNALAKEAGFAADDFVFVAGSTQLEEDLIAADVFAELKSKHPKLKMVLVPRHPDRSIALQKKLADRQIKSTLRTQLKSSREPVDVLIVDVIGELGSWWGRANSAYVGGSMGEREGQNMIEPAAYGVPVSFGPRTKNFRDVVAQLKQADAVTVVENAGRLRAFLEHCITSPRQAREIGQRGQRVVEENRGASKVTAASIAGLVKTSRSSVE